MTTLTPAPRSSLRWFLSDALALTRRSVVHEVRQLDGLLVTVLLPVMMLLLFVYVFGGAIAVDGDYLAYVVPGIVVVTAGYGAATTATALTDDLTSGAIDRFRSLPMSPAALFAGHVGAALLRTLTSTALVFATAIAIGFRPTTSPLAWLGVAAIVASFILAIAWTSVVFGVISRTVQAAGGFSFFVLFLPYLSSAFVPPETLPSFLRPFAEHQFVTPVIETLRALLFGQPAGRHGVVALLWCAAIVAITVPIAAVSFRRRVTR